MSTRNLGLLTSTAAVAFAFGGFAGAALVDAPNPHGTNTVPAAAVAAPEPPVEPAKPAAPAKPAVPSTPAKSAKAVAEDGTDLKSCADGKCEVVVRDGDVIKLDDRFRMGPIGVEVEGNYVTLTRRDDGTRATITVAPGMGSAYIYWDGLSMRPRMTEDGEVVLKLRHRDTGAKPAEEKPAEEKPADTKPGDQKPADQKPAEEKPSGKQ